jgi:hypothetical protein
MHGQRVGIARGTCAIADGVEWLGASGWRVRTCTVPAGASEKPQVVCLTLLGDVAKKPWVTFDCVSHQEVQNIMTIYRNFYRK